MYICIYNRAVFHWHRFCGRAIAKLRTLFTLFRQPVSELKSRFHMDYWHILSRFVLQRVVSSSVNKLCNNHSSCGINFVSYRIVLSKFKKFFLVLTSKTNLAKDDFFRQFFFGNIRKCIFNCFSIAAKMVLSCRFYKEKYPEVEDVVMVNVRSIAEMGAYVHLLEYNNIEGMILLSELSRRRIRSINKLIRVGKTEPVVVIRVDKEKGIQSTDEMTSQDICIPKHWF